LLIESEVAVIGGGPAGIAAAISAARMGANVALVEKNPFLGGNACLGLSLHGFFDFQGEPCIGGIGWELVERLKDIGGSPGAVNVKNAHITKVVPINEDLFQIVCMELIEKEGIRFLPHTICIDAVSKGSRIEKVKIQNRSGSFDLAAQVFIDCTGDADLCAALGVPLEKGRPQDGALQPMGQMFRLGRVNIERFLRKAGVGVAHAVLPDISEEFVVWFSATLSPWNDVIEEQNLFMGKDRIFWGNSVIPGQYNLNLTRVAGFDATRQEDLAQAEFAGKKQVFEGYQFLKKFVDGFEDSVIVKVAPFVGTRETRRLKGEYQLTVEDFFEDHLFEDTVALSGYPIDIHDPKGGSSTSFQQSRKHGTVGIPYRCLYNSSCTNLLVAGRPISATHEVHGATRVMATCMATGHAAGVAARLCVENHIGLQSLDTGKLRAELKRQNVLL
jgi:hypothetical protein